MVIDQKKLDSLKAALKSYEATHGTVSYTPQTATNCANTCYGSCHGTCWTDCVGSCKGSGAR